MKIQKMSTKLATLFLALLLTVSMFAQSVSATESDFGGQAIIKTCTEYSYEITNPYADVDWVSFGQYKANLHTHTIVSSDVSNNNFNVRNMVEAYYAADYDILSINDHANISRNWDQYATANGPLTTARYNEILSGADRGGRGMTDVPHSNEQNNMMRGRHVLSFFTDWNANAPVSTLTGLFAAIATYDQVFTGINNAGGIGYVAHPGRELYGIIDNGHRNFESFAAHLADIFLKYPNAAYGLEIFGVHDSETHNDRVLWDRMLEITAPQGKNVFGISNDDAHATGELGRGGSKTTFVMSENNVGTVEAAMKNGAFYASSKMILNDRIGFERAFDFRNNSTPQPVISKISIDGNTISVEGDHYQTIEWISGVGNLVATGSSIDLVEYKDVIGSYIRFQLKGEGGITWANPMLLVLNETIAHDLGEVQPVEDDLLQGIVYCLHEDCDFFEYVELPEITSIRIDASVSETVRRGEVYSFDTTLNKGAFDFHIVWTLSDPSLAIIDGGDIYILNRTGTVRLIATDPVSGLSHSITLRIAS